MVQVRSLGGGGGGGRGGQLTFLMSTVPPSTKTEGALLHFIEVQGRHAQILAGGVVIVT